MENYRNGFSKKNVNSQYGHIPRDREAKFEPIIIKKYERDISELVDMIFVLYSRGMPTRDVSDFMFSKYGVNYSPAQISQLTNEIVEDVRLWQERKLETYYPIIYIDAVHFHVVDNNVVTKKATYVIMGINGDGQKEILGLYIGENESAKFWMSVLNALKNRGISKINIICSDNLKGIQQSIEAVFPDSKQQRCIVHMIRNSVKYVNYKDMKEFCNDLKSVYQSNDVKNEMDNLDIFEDKWGKKYPTSISIWRRNWSEISTMFDYSPEIRKLIYTTNPIENLNSVFRKYTKTKRVFPSDDSLLKILFLASQQIIKKWSNSRIRNWSSILNEFKIINFENEE
nr:IS256 family transposase [Mycoplasmopsis fermentans]